MLNDLSIRPYFVLVLLFLGFARTGKSQCALTLFPSSEYDCVTNLAVVGFTVGGTGGVAPYTCTFVNVSNNSTVATGSTSTNTGTVINLPQGIYNVFVTSANNCTVASIGFQITFNQSVANSSFNSSSVSCYGGSNGVVSVLAPSSFSFPLSFTWSPGNYSTQIVSTLSAGIVYSVTVGDSQGCLVTNTVTLAQPLPISSTVSTNFVPCFGGSIQAAPSSTGGYAPYTYSLNGLSSGSMVPLSAGIQTLLTKDANACLKTTTILVTQAPQVIINFNTLSPSCPGLSDGSLNALVSVGPAPYSFFWQPVSSSSSNLNNIPAGTYTLTVTDASACITRSVTTVAPPVPITSTAITVPENCSAANGSFTIQASGGTAPYTYTTVPGGSNSYSLANISSGTYTTIIQDFKQCKDTLVFLVGNLSTVSLSIANITTVSCHNSCSGSVLLSVQNGNPPFTFSASGLPLTTSNSITAMCPGYYLIKVLDANLCPATTTVQLSNPPLLTYSVAQPPLICVGKSSTLTAQAQGGTGSLSFKWNPGNLTGQQVIVTPNTTTVYSLNVFDANGCTSTSYQVTVSVNPPLNISVNPNGTGVCPGTTAQITPTVSGGDGIYTYLWLPGNTSESSLYIENISVPSYTFIVNDNCGSPTAVKVIDLQLFEIIPPTYTVTSSKGCEPLCTKFINTSPKSIKTYWSYGDDANEGSGDTTLKCYQKAGRYNILLTVLDQHSCTATSWFPQAIEVFPKPLVDFITDPSKINRSNSAHVLLKDASNDAVAFNWYLNGNFIGNEKNIYADFPDTLCYEVTLVAWSSNQCKDSVVKPICVYEDFNLFMPNVFTPNADGLNDWLLPQGTGWSGEDYSFEIYNEWGERIFHTNEIGAGWNGNYRINNSNAKYPKTDQEDAYLWVVEIKDKLGQKHKLNGSVIILR